MSCKGVADPMLKLSILYTNIPSGGSRSHAKVIYIRYKHPVCKCQHFPETVTGVPHFERRGSQQSLITESIS
uniref:Uncharacterized protein n=1 Tax=Arion vulgaris TaxID=1028688 RepID=A0A0B6ZEQ9_9EUPU